MAKHMLFTDVSVVEIPRAVNPVRSSYEAAELILRALANQPQPEPDDYQMLLRAMTERTTVVAQDGAGCVVSVGAFRRISPAAGVIEDVATSHKVRNQGVGAKVIRALESTARADGLRHLMVYPTLPSEGFYNRLGYFEQTDWTKLL